jgi:rare lipoprotein A
MTPWSVVLSLSIGLALAGCATAQRDVPVRRDAAPPRAPAPPPPRAEPAPPAQVGKASWYGRPHHGRKTASGEIYDMNALTAAHRTLPLGTRVRVTNTDNGRSVVVRINDRGPFVDGRVIDLSRAAARELGATGHGLVPVRIEVLEDAASGTSADEESR